MAYPVTPHGNGNEKKKAPEELKSRVDGPNGREALAHDKRNKDKKAKEKS
jgi:hypothetical protein